MIRHPVSKDEMSYQVSLKVFFFSHLFYLLIFYFFLPAPSLHQIWAKQ